MHGLFQAYKYTSHTNMGPIRGEYEGVLQMEWLKDNLESSDILAALILIAIVIMALNDVGGEDLPKVVLGGLVGYLSRRAGVPK